MVWRNTLRGTLRYFQCFFNCRNYVSLYHFITKLLPSQLSVIFHIFFPWTEYERLIRKHLKFSAFVCWYFTNDAHTHSISELKLAYWQHFIGSSTPIYHIWILYGMHRVSDCDQYSPLSSEYKGSNVRPGYGRAPLIRFDLFHPGLISIVLYVSGNLHNVCDKPAGSYSIKYLNTESFFSLNHGSS